MNLFSRTKYNPQLISNVDVNNTEKLQQLNYEIKKEYGSRINKEVISIIALKRFFDCYNNKEIIQVLKYFEQL